MMASKLKTVNMEDNLDTSSSKKDEMQLGPEYLVKDKIKIEPMYSSPMASLVLSDSSQLTDDGFEKLPDQIMYPYAEPYDLQKHMEFNSIKYFDGAVKSEVQDIFEPSSKSGSPSAELEERCTGIHVEGALKTNGRCTEAHRLSEGSRTSQRQWLNSAQVADDVSRPTWPRQSVPRVFRFPLDLIPSKSKIEFVNMNIKLEVPEPSNDCVLPSTREENEMNLNSTKSEVDIFEPSSHYGFIFIKEEHEEVNKQNTASSQNSEEQVLGQNSSEYDDTKKQLMGFKCNEKDCYKQALRLGLCTAHGGGSKKRCSVDYVQHMEVAINVVKKIVLHELRKADYVQHTEVCVILSRVAVYPTPLTSWSTWSSIRDDAVLPSTLGCSKLALMGNLDVASYIVLNLIRTEQSIEGNKHRNIERRNTDEGGQKEELTRETHLRGKVGTSFLGSPLESLDVESQSSAAGLNRNRIPPALFLVFPFLSPMASLVLTDSFETLPDQIMYTYTGPNYL
uniref:Uncharacterized protein n=1 Tax=Timema shepardi TaxID=629360 RepID=A0A7R9APW3_TIMSH|nr:unnamed protein product [Timema shepardi]